MTVTFMMDMKVAPGTDLTKLQDDIQELMSKAPAEVAEIAIDFLGVTEEAGLKDTIDHFYGNMATTQTITMDIETPTAAHFIDEMATLPVATFNAMTERG